MTRQNLSDEERGRIEEEEKKWDERLRELKEANLRTSRITAEDLSVTINRCEPRYRPSSQRREDRGYDSNKSKYQR